MIQYGFYDNLVNWLKEFLNNRSKREIINNTLSDPLKINSGVPQCGIIGPLLFLIYISDINSNTHIKSEISLFADDAKVFSKSETSLQLTLDNIHKCLMTQKLYINQKYCQVLTINKNKPLPIYFVNNKNKILAVKVFKHLGICISKNLKSHENVKCS